MKKIFCFFLIIFFSSECFADGPIQPGLIPTINSIGIVFNNTRLIYLNNVALANGANAVYTVPANYIMVPLQRGAYNNNGTSSTINYTLTRSATTYRIEANVTVSSNAVNTTTGAAVFLQAGDILGINASQGNIEARFSFLLIPAGFIKSVLFTAFAVGDNTVYTCCSAGHTVAVLSSNTGSFGSITGQLLYGNTTGGARTIKGYFLPSGQATSAIYQFLTSISVSDQTIQNTGSSGSGSTLTFLSLGDSIVINTDANTAGQYVFMNVFEK